MRKFRLTLMDSDSRAQARTDLALGAESAGAFSSFLASMMEELIIGQTEYLEIEGDRSGTVRLAVCRSE